MTALEQCSLVSEKDYLKGELQSDIRHEYLNGTVHAMAGGKNLHNIIASNILGILHGKLRGKPCRPFNSDTKVRINQRNDKRYYYPDVTVVCDSNPADDTFQDKPVIIFEVVSQSTRRTDLEEKREAYRQIEALDTYVIVEQNTPTLIVHRKNAEGGFDRSVVAGLDLTLDLPSIDTSLTLAEIYEDLEIA